MSANVDERIVQLRFDNGQFERDISKTIDTLEKFRDSLDFSGSVKGLDKLDFNFKASVSGMDEVSKASDKLNSEIGKINSSMGTFGGFDFSKVGSDIDFIASRFTAMGKIADTTLTKVAEQVTNIGAAALKSAGDLTVGQVDAGYEQYEKRMLNVAALVNQTGMTEDEVYNELEKLSWFSDATSYSNSEMTSALQTFVNSGEDIEESIDLLYGLSTAMSASGISAKEGSKSFATWANVISNGGLTSQYYKPLNNTYHALSADIKKDYIEVGKELGRLSKDTDVDVGNFGSTLLNDDTGEYWVNADVIKTVYERYGHYAKEVQELVSKHKEETGVLLTTTEAMDMLDEQTRAAGEEVDAFGRHALEAASQARTLTEAVDAVKDQSATAWSQVFENLFGRAEEAAEFFTAVGDELIDIFVPPIQAIQAMTFEFKQLGGREELVQSVFNIFKALHALMAPIKEAFTEIFPPVTVQALVDLAKRFREFTETLILSDEAAANIKAVFKAIFAVLDLGIRTVKMFGQIIGNIIKVLKPGTDVLGNWIVKLSNFIVNIHDAVIESGFFEKAVEAVTAAFKFLYDAVSPIIDWIVLKIKSLYTTLKESVFIQDAIASIVSAFNTVKTSISKVVGVLKNSTGNIKMTWNELMAVFSKDNEHLVEGHVNVFTKLSNTFQTLKAHLEVIWGFLKSMFANIKNELGPVDELASNVWATVVAVVTGIYQFLKPVLSGLVTLLNNFFNNLKNEDGTVNFQKIIDAIKNGGILVIIYRIQDALRAITKSLDKDGGLLGTLKKSIKDVTGTFKEMLVQMTPGSKQQKQSSMIRELAISIAILAGSMVLLSMADSEKLANSLVVILGLLGAMLYVVQALNKLTIADNGIFNARDGSVFSLLLGKEGSKGKLGFNKSTTGVSDILKLAEAVLILAAAVGLLSLIEPGKLWSSVAAVGLILAALLALIFALSKMKMAENSALTAKFASSFVIIALAVAKLANVVRKLAELDTGDLWNAVGAVAALIAMLAVLTLAIAWGTKIAGFYEGDSLGKSMLGAAFSMIIIAGAIMALSFALKMLNSVNTEENPDALKEGLIAVAEILGGFAIFALMISSLGPNVGVELILAATAMVIMAAGLAAIGYAVTLISDKLTTKTMERGLGSMVLLIFMVGTLLAVLSVVNTKTNGVMNAGVAFAAVAGGLLLLSAAFRIMAALQWSQLLIGLAAIAISLGLIVGACYLLQPVLITLTSLADSLKNLGIAVLGIGAGTLLLVAALLLIGPNIITLVLAILTGLSLFILGFIKMKTLIAEGFKAMIQAICEALIGSLDSIFGVLEFIVFNLLERLMQFGEPIAAALHVLIISVLRGLTEHIEEYWDALFNFIAWCFIGLGKAIIENGPKLILAFKYVTNSIFIFLLDFLDSILAIFGPLTSGLRKGLSGVRDTITEELNDEEARLKAEELAKAAGDGIEQGGEEAEQKAEETGGSIFSKFTGLFSKENGESTGSNFITSIADGFSNGAANSEGKVSGDITSFIKNSVTDNFDSSAAQQTGYDYSSALGTGLDLGFDSQADVVSSSSYNLKDLMTGAFNPEDAKITGYDYGSNIGSGLCLGIDGQQANAMLSSESLMQSVVNQANETLDTHSPSKVFEEIGQYTVAGLIQGLNNYLSDLLSNMADLMSSAISAAEEKLPNFRELGRNIVDGIKNGINGAKSLAKEAASGVVAAVTGTMNKGFDIHSPSRVMMETGKYLVMGLAKGIKDYTENALWATTDMTTSLKNSVADSFKTVQDIIDGTIDAEPVIRPVLDLSEIQNGSKTISSIMPSASISTNVDSRTSTQNQLMEDLRKTAIDMAKSAQEMMVSKLDSSTLTESMRDAMSGMGVFMDSNKVGSLVTRYQTNARIAARG